jgi:DNA-binding YbaB/EbfC family protein
MGSGFLKKKKAARELQSQMSMLQQSLSSQLESVEAEGVAGNGLVTVTLSGSGEMRRIRINPECVDKEDMGGLEALIKAAHNDALKKAQESVETPSIGDLSGLSLLGM